MCSFIIIVVSLTRIRFELFAESVTLLATTMKPRESALSSAQFCEERNCSRGWPVDAPYEYTTFLFHCGFDYAVEQCFRNDDSAILVDNDGIVREYRNAAAGDWLLPAYEGKARN